MSDNLVDLYIDPTNQKKTLEEWLKEVDYEYLNSPDYIPSDFALFYKNFIDIVNGEDGEDNLTPAFHLAMIDKLTLGDKYIVNLCFRGAGKTVVFAEYFFPFLAVFNELPGLDNITGAIYVSDSMDNGVKSLRKNIQYRYENSEALQKLLPHVHFTDKMIEFTNARGIKFGLKMYGATTGIRGTKIYGKRPQIAVLDDLMSDENAKSEASLSTIEDTVFNGVFPALDTGERRRVIVNGTPFNKQDIMLKIVESGGFQVNVWPVCESFPCTEEEFKGAWEDRFSYKHVKEQYELMEKLGKKDAFYQELMLQITSDEERLVSDGEIQWYSRKSLLQNRHNFNFYITTDFAVSSREKADNSVISVWAYGPNGDWFWVDGMCKRTTMDETQDKLFEFAQEYQPLSVGIEATGQQAGFISLFQKEMMERNIYFNFARSGNSPGIRPTRDKLTRFNMVVPLFKAGKIYFPEEMKDSIIIKEFLEEIRLATVNGLKGRDDCLDTISMLHEMNPWKPAKNSSIVQDNVGSIWKFKQRARISSDNLSSYIV